MTDHDAQRQELEFARLVAEEICKLQTPGLDGEPEILLTTEAARKKVIEIANYLASEPKTKTEN